ncbi:MAG: hypothetical protein WC141_05745 [Arcobacteraceae bacterium]
MFRYFFAFLLTQSILFSCALCVYYSPLTIVSFKVHSTSTTIETIDFKWELSSEFTQQLLEIYDTNLNKKIDKDELELVQNALLDYGEPKNFMTYVSYGKEVSKNQFLTLKTSKYKTKIEQGKLLFYYTAQINAPLKANYKLHIYVNDEEDYFLMELNKQLLVFKNGVNIHKNIIDKQTVVFTVDESFNSGLEEVLYEKEEETPISKSNEISEVNITTNENTALQTQSFLEWFTPKLKEQLQKVQQGDIWALVVLLFISFGYGMVHAIGPGHGKALAFSYFSSHKSTFTKAFLISMASSFVHIVGALVLVLVSLFILESFFNNFVKDSVAILTQISATMIMLLAAYLFYNTLKNKACACNSCQTKSKTTALKWSSENPTPLNIKTKFYKKDLYFVLTAGLIPCPGTVILFIYAFVLKTYLAVFLAAVFISLGMALVIVATSFLGIGVRKFGEKSHQYTRILETVSPLVMFILGVLLLFSV